MAPRANWKGFLKLSLVSCSVAMVQATSTKERIRFNIINRDTGNRVRYRQVDAETGEEAPQKDRVKGYKAFGRGSEGRAPRSHCTARKGAGRAKPLKRAS